MKDRLDILLVKRGLAESREKAKAVIMSGIVYVDGQKEDKAGQTFSENVNIEVRGNTLKYVSRGGLKLAKAMDSGTFFLLICGGYQLFGQYYVNADGHKIQGLGFFDYVTEKSKSDDRCIGNIYLDVEIDGERFDVLGFENHGGQTYGNDESYFGKVIFGNGNYYGAKSEGFYKDNVLGTYIHGPLLPKNPALADFIIRKALLKNHGEVSLGKLDDSIEVNAKKELLENLGQKRIIED